MIYAASLVVLTGCLATAGPTVAYRPCSHELATGWDLEMLAMKTASSSPPGPGITGGITAGQTFGAQSPGHDTFFAARAAFGSEMLWSAFQQDFYASADLGLSLHDWDPGVYAGASPIWLRSVHDNGEVHLVVALRLGLRYVSGGTEVYLAPDVGILLPPFGD